MFEVVRTVGCGVGDRWDVVRGLVMLMKYECAPYNELYVIEGLD